jgi:hypothetical protein
MKLLPLRLAATCAAPFLFSSCLLTLIPLPRHVPYDAAAFAPYGRTGSGTVSGRVTQNSQDTSTWDEGPEVKLLPDTAYTEETVQRDYINGANLQRADSRAKRYERTVKADVHGNFAFHGVPPGKYVVASNQSWYAGTDNQTDSDGNNTSVPRYDSAWTYARVTVGNGQAVRVERWSGGE